MAVKIIGGEPDDEPTDQFDELLLFLDHGPMTALLKPNQFGMGRRPSFGRSRTETRVASLDV